MFFYIVHDGATGDLWVHIYSCAFLLKALGIGLIEQAFKQKSIIVSTYISEETHFQKNISEIPNAVYENNFQSRAKFQSTQTISSTSVQLWYMKVHVKVTPRVSGRRKDLRVMRWQQNVLLMLYMNAGINLVWSLFQQFTYQLICLATTYRLITLLNTISISYYTYQQYCTYQSILTT